MKEMKGKNVLLNGRGQEKMKMPRIKEALEQSSEIAKTYTHPTLIEGI